MRTLWLRISLRITHILLPVKLCGKVRKWRTAIKVHCLHSNSPLSVGCYLSPLTFGLLSIWLVPYMNATYANAYRTIKGNEQIAIPEWISKPASYIVPTVFAAIMLISGIVGFVHTASSTGLHYNGPSCCSACADLTVILALSIAGLVFGIVAGIVSILEFNKNKELTSLET